MLGELEPDQATVADFSIARTEIKFSADGDVFYCVPTLGPAVLQSLAAALRKLSSVGRELSSTVAATDDDADRFTRVLDRIMLIGDVFATFLKPESAELFKTRLESHERGLDVNRQVVPMLHYVLEQYGLRPTEPSSDSSSGSVDGTSGTTSTAGAPVAALTR